MKENRFVSWIRRHPIWSIVIALLFFVIIIPVLINYCYSCNNIFYITQWEAKDVLTFYGTLLGAIATLSGLIITIWITRKQIQRESFLNREIAKWTKVEDAYTAALSRIEPETLLCAGLEKRDSNCNSILNEIRSFQVCCSRTLNQLLNYPQREYVPEITVLNSAILEAIQSLLIVCSEEHDRYTKLLDEEQTFFPSYTTDNSGMLRPDEAWSEKKCAQYKKFVYKEEQARKAFDQKLMEINAKEYRDALVHKADFFEFVYIDIQKKADNMLSLWRR